MFYKVIHNNKIIDVLKDPQFLSYQQRNNIFLRSEEKFASGVLSSDSSTIYLINPDLVIENYLQITYLKITEDEYLSLSNELSKNKTIDNIIINNEDDNKITESLNPEVKEEVVARKSEVLETIDSLKSEIETLKNNNEMLVECVLELSQKLYKE